VIHLEKVTSERVMGRDRDVWDVHTDKELLPPELAPPSRNLVIALDARGKWHFGS
jgi:hypothetical protein